MRFEHLLLLAVVLVLAHAGPRSRQLLGGLYPFGLAALLFDGMRPYQKLGLSVERVHVCDLRAVEASLFGYRDGGTARTLHDFFRSITRRCSTYLRHPLRHLHPVVRRGCGLSVPQGP